MLEKLIMEIVTAVISIIVTIIANWIRKHPPVSHPKVWSRIAVIAMIISMLILIITAGIVFWEILGPKEPMVEINYPSDGATVEIREMIKGTSQNISNDQVIWVVIYPQVVGYYFPQNDPAEVQANGDWSSLAFIGTEKDTGIKFDIIAVLVNKDAQDVFNEYFTQSESEKSWPGINKLPNGAVTYDRITITRN